MNLSFENKIENHKREMGIDFLELSKKYEAMELTDTQEVAVVGYVFIRNRAQQLGLKIADFEPLEVIDKEEHRDYFSEYFSNSSDAEAVYDHKMNSISSKYQPDLSLLSHEMIHYFSATENIPNAILNKNRFKSGFNATYIYEKPQNIETDKDSFRYLNEGITDKLAFDLYKDVSEIDIGAVYEKVFPTKAKEGKESSLKRLEDNLKNVEEKRKNLLAEAKNIINETDRLEEENRINTSTDSFIKRTTSFWKNQSEVHIYGDYLKDIKNEEHSAYKPFIDLVDDLIKGVAISKVADSVSENLELAKKETWIELQKAYFTGNVMYLRSFEKIYGDNFLRKLGTLDTATVVDGKWKEWDDILYIIKKKNAELKSELENKELLH